MEKQVVRYAEFFGPGSFVANSWTEEIPTGDPKWPDWAYAYQMYVREDVHDGDGVYKGKPKKEGKLIYHPDSTIETVAEIEARHDNSNHILLMNMRRNKWASVVLTRWGNWPQPWDDEKMEIAR